MRNIIYGVLLTLLVCASAIAESRPTTYDQLPDSARNLLKEHFATLTINQIEVEQSLFGRTYTVLFTNGDQIEFDHRGEWQEIEQRRGIARSLLPKGIRRTLDKEFEGAEARSMERTRQGYEVELRGGLELKFNRAEKLIDVDD